MGLLVAGNNPAALKTANRAFFTATAGQTTFTVPNGYQVGDIDVYLNGIRLLEVDDYLAVNGSTVVLTSGVNAGDSVAVVSYNQFLVSNSYSKTEADSRYLQLTGGSMSSYIRAPNYGISSYSDSAFATLEANPGLGEQGVGIKAFGRSMATTGGDILYTADSRGAGGRHRFGYWNGTSFTDTMTINKTTGYITKPYQPAFRGYDPSAGDNAAVTFTSTDSSFSGRNSNFNASTGLFTAPVAGAYLFTFCFLHGNGGSASYVRCLFKVNGSSSTSYADTLEDWQTSYKMTSASVVLRLQVNDTVGLQNEGRKIYGPSYGSFSGIFLG